MTKTGDTSGPSDRRPPKPKRSGDEHDVVVGYKPHSRPPAGHAVLYVSSTERRIRRVVGRAVEVFHEVLWHNQGHGRTEDLAAYFKIDIYDPDFEGEPA